MIQFEGLGDQSISRTFATLVVKVSVSADPEQWRVGNDIYCSIFLTLAQAYSTKTLRVNTVHGQSEINFTVGTSKYTIVGQGVRDK